MNTEMKMVKKRILFIPIILLIGLVVITLLLINSTRNIESNPIFIAQPKDLLTSNEILFENLNTISGDQRHLSFVTAEDYGMKSNKIWITDADGSSPIIVGKADGMKFVSNPIFSPDSRKLSYIKTYPFQIWVYDIDTAINKNVEPDDKKLEKYLNPSLGYGGETYFKWKSNNEIEFENNLVYPAQRYTINIQTREIKESGNGESTKQAIVDVPLTSQRDDLWGNKMLGGCDNQTIATAGCAVTSVVMLLKSFGYDTNPDKLNTFLTNNDNQGYAEKCDIKWYAVPNYVKGIRLVGAFFYEKTFKRLDYELEKGNSVIIGFNSVPFTNIQHWVVVTKKEGNSYKINDPWSLDGKEKTLDDFGGKFDHLIVYEKTS
ncbi:MAG: C39 family peptidase [Candidatus Dojkabacteria bacterium]